MIDLHLHSTCSDGKDTIKQLIENVKNAGIEYFSITDHDTSKAGREILMSDELKSKIKEYGLTYVTGCEFSVIYGKQEMHILAYDFDPFAPEIFEIEKKFAELLEAKDKFRLKYVEDHYKLSQESYDYLASKENVRKLDFANCLVNDGYFDNLDDACQKFLNLGKYDGVDRLDAVYVLTTLKKLGAKLVWAHSLHGLNEKAISLADVERFATELKEYGLAGLECYYSLYTKEEIDGLVDIADRLGLSISAGSDYHGKNKNVAIAQFSIDGSAPNFEKVSVIKSFTDYVI